MTTRYVLDTGALIAAERGKERATAFFRLAEVGRAELWVPIPVLAEWWRGRTDRRDAILRATRVAGSVEAAKAAGVALAELGGAPGKHVVDAMVVAMAALLDAVVVTGDREDFERIGACFPGVTILST